MSQALKEAYQNNPELNAERENIKVSKSDLNISRSDFLPSITLSGSKSSEDTSRLTNRDGTNASITDVNPESKSVKIEQKIFQGFGGVADFKKSNGVDLSGDPMDEIDDNFLKKVYDTPMTFDQLSEVADEVFKPQKKYQRRFNFLDDYSVAHIRRGDKVDGKWKEGKYHELNEYLDCF